MTLPDVQNETDARSLHIEEVGITGLRYPISVASSEQGKQDTVATFTLSTSLSAEHRGSHLSRFIEALEADGGDLSPRNVAHLVDALRERLGSSTARLRIQFTYFRRRYAPVSGASALVGYECTATAKRTPDRFSLRLGVRAPVTSVCPCSKAISDYGAHNQRGHISVVVTPALDQDTHRTSLWYDELIDVAEGAGSSPIYPLLKREDERHVTMAGYDRAVFVEDMVRAVADHLRGDHRVERFTVEALNDESIHDHGAFARLSWPPTDSYDD